MIKVMVLVKAKDGLSLEEFRTYYETKHAPLASRLYPMFSDYRRNYVQIDNDARVPSGKSLPFDVITELSFATEEDYQRFIEKRGQPEVRAEILADEAKFMAPNTLWSFVVRQTRLPSSVQG